MFEHLYTVITLINSAVCFTLALAFLLLRVSRKETLKNYRAARFALAMAYLAVSIISTLEILFQPNNSDLYYTGLIYLIVSSSQALLFTYTLITLLDRCFTTRRKIIKELLPILALTGICFIVYYLGEMFVFKIAFYTFAGYYLFLLFRYTYLFRKVYCAYIQRIDNYYSAQENFRLRWVLVAFYWALGIGILVMAGVIMSAVANTIVAFILMVYYLYFGICFINYAFLFQNIEAVVESPTQPKVKVTPNKSIYADMERRMEQWLKHKHFTHSGITIEQVAADLCSNREYVSQYVNNVLNKTFREWINDLRIEQAKQLLLEDSHLPVGDIGIQVGFSDKSNFGRQFSRKTGLTPNAWREKQMQGTTMSQPTF
jgi:AraC-like DNA-binding protein